jgi:hypothetical protein
MFLSRWQKALAVVELLLLLLAFDVYRREQRRVNNEQRESRLEVTYPTQACFK